MYMYTCTCIYVQCIYTCTYISHTCGEAVEKIELLSMSTITLALSLSPSLSF